MPNPTTLAMEEELLLVSEPGNHGGADITQTFYYLAGPMSGIPKHNFPAFDSASAKLRARGYNIVSPAELDTEKLRAKHLRSRKGKIELDLYRECLRRDLRDYICNENLIGVICLDGWWKSTGAQWETGLAEFFGAPLLRFEDGEGDDFALIEFDRTTALTEGGWE